MIPRPLLDRMEVIEVMGYTEEEKVKIAQKYLLPKVLESHGLSKNNVKIPVRTVRTLINYYTRESGVRNLERELSNLVRKVARKIVTNGEDCYEITTNNIEDYLGKKKYRFEC